MKNVTEIIFMVLGLALLGLAFGMLFAFPVKWLWNWLMPDLFGLKTIDVFQAWGLSVLCSFLFKSTSVSSK